MPQSDTVSWNSMVQAYAQDGHVEQARDVFERMPRRNVVLFTALIQAYARRGEMEEAKRLFDEMPQRDVVAWTTMVVGYAQAEMVECDDRSLRSPRETLRAKHLGLVPVLFEMTRVQCLGMSWPAIVTLDGLWLLLDVECLVFDLGYQIQNSLLCAAKETHTKCIRDKFADCIGQGDGSMITRALYGFDGFRHLHFVNPRKTIQPRVAHEVPARDLMNLVSWNILLAAYARNGDIAQARCVFQSMPRKDQVSWNGMIQAYVKTGLLERAMEVFRAMPSLDTISWTTVVAAFAKAGDLCRATELFDLMPHKNVIDKVPEGEQRMNRIFSEGIGTIAS
ncbi:pentatricopeptide repeat-containing protein At4g02750-like [Selaginella moellendorffii]|uniref:pentatricopeptide repeat-containing protein At4g02750-like n=1 Tax=Selaginella moellendorffii TaxID=88036 RepID=UPI000D1CA57F|nr:pentatricopeptide repeat-containing protein At4g02750-like [Selaginella moellendorffii]|eukprot:XP_024539378.1 pentatricopeptide repeat-containing protein At4g02750-like [Selaginella moellendorffii]